MAREWTEEQKQAARERLAAARAKKAQMKLEEADVAEPAQENVVEDIGTPSNEELMKMVLELKAELANRPSNPNDDLASAIRALAGNQSTGAMSKTLDKHDTNLKIYPDIRERLAAEPRLRKVAFDVNFELDWKTEVVRYQVADGTWRKEPKFYLQLVQLVLDDQGEATNKRMGRAQLIFFEDPETAVIVAQQQGLPIDEDSSTEFLNEMRYIRARDWLFECFWPAPQMTDKGNFKDEVVGGTVISTWEIGVPVGGAAPKIPFDQMRRS